jgi:DNA repair protein RadC
MAAVPGASEPFTGGRREMVNDDSRHVIRRLRDMPNGEKPRERLEHYGAGALATAELLAIVLRTGRQGANALDIGQQLMAEFGLPGLARASIDELCRTPGCGRAKAVQIKAAIELGRRLMVQAPAELVQISTPADAAAMLLPEMALLEQEHLRVVLLNARNHVVGVHEVYKGSVSASPVRVAEVFREAVRRNCASIIVAHNHPSGDPTPSREDVHVTRQIVSAGQLLDIDVLDHLIIGHDRWISLRERGQGFS